MLPSRTFKYEVGDLVIYCRTEVGVILERYHSSNDKQNKSYNILFFGDMMFKRFGSNPVCLAEYLLGPASEV